VLSVSCTNKHTPFNACIITITTTTTSYPNREVKCAGCARQFIYSASDQAFFAAKKYAAPARCAACRTKKADFFAAQEAEAKLNPQPLRSKSKGSSSKAKSSSSSSSSGRGAGGRGVSGRDVSGRGGRSSSSSSSGSGRGRGGQTSTSSR
jgi:Probable zinc-ribbon domain